MKAPTVCPNCHSTFSVSKSIEGKQAKCPKCAQNFIITFELPLTPTTATEPTVAPFQPPSPPMPPVMAPPPLPSLSTAESTKSKATSGVVLPQWVVIVAPSVICLIIGFLAGREHFKYQIRSAFEEAAAGLANGFKERSQPSFPSQSSPEKSDATSAVVPSFSQPEDNTTESLPQTKIDEPSVAEKQEAKKLPQLGINDTYTAKNFTLTLTDAKIGLSQLKSLTGSATGKMPDLIFSFTIMNTDERRILRFDNGNSFMGGKFKLRDDVDNVIRGIDYGFGTKVIGALTGSEDIPPGTSANHIELFTVPPPKTEYLVLTVDLSCFGDEGVVEFKIPASAISK